MSSGLVIFDFDGTIADTFDTGIKVINKLSRRYNSPEMGEEEIEAYRNLGLKRTILMMIRKGASWLKIIKIARLIHPKLNEEISKVKLFDGIDKVIKSLKKQGYVLGIVSTNTTKNINDFLKKHKLKKMFDFVESVGIWKTKTGRLRRIMKKNGVKPDEVIYIGDETRDIKAGNKLGIRIISATWGFHSRGALKNYQPKYLANKPEEILGLIKNGLA